MTVEQAIAGYLDSVRTGWDDLVAARAPLDPLDLADGSRYLAAIVEGALLFVHADPARPLVVPWVTPDRRWADNGADSRYWMVPVDGAHRYRIHGVRGDERYLSFTVYAGTAGHPEHVARNVNHLELEAANGAPYELVVEPPPDACYVIARQYFEDPAREAPATIAVEVLDGPLPGVPGDDDLAARWRTAAGFVRAMTRPRARRPQPSYAAAQPNRIGQPAGWRSDEGGGRGTPDQTYALGRFELADGEALVMDVRVPQCVYASVVVWNRFGQSVDTRVHRSTRNRRELTTGADGSARVVVAATDPGVPNWLDTGGRRRGTIFWRFLLVGEQPQPIAAHVVPLSELGESAARGTDRASPVRRDVGH